MSGSAQTSHADNARHLRLPKRSAAFPQSGRNTYFEPTEIAVTRVNVAYGQASPCRSGMRNMYAVKNGDDRYTEKFIVDR